MVKKQTKNVKFKNHSILDFFKNFSPESTQSKSSDIKSNKIPKKNNMNNINIKPKNAKRKIRHFKTIKKIKPKKPKLNNDFSNYSNESSINLNDSNYFSNKSKNNDESSSSSLDFNFSSRKNEKINSELNFNRYKFLLDGDENDNDNDNDIIDIKPEWMKEETEEIMYSKLRYNCEILDYIEYITPNHWQKAKREIAFDKLEKLIKSYNPEMKLVLFGSSGQNTCTVFSDIDVSVIDENNTNNYIYSERYELNRLMYFLIENNYSYDLRLINAKVPILKGTCASNGIKIDISYNRKNGYNDSLDIKNILDRNGIMRQAIIILKILLKQNCLNEPYSGGMSSYLLFHLVYFYDIQCKKSSNMKYHNIFFFLYLFLEYFGTQFDFDRFGISLNKENPGKIFLKYGKYYMDDYSHICVEGISERYTNIGKNCFNYEKVVNLFKSTFYTIQNEQEKNALSLLKKLGFPSNKIEILYNII